MAGWPILKILLTLEGGKLISFIEVVFPLTVAARIRSAFLRFASSNTWRDVNDVPAPVIGTLLGSHGIKSVVLNACQSARANEGVNANLSATFAEHGVSNILALSSKMLSNAVSSLILKFYEELFLRRQTFSEAASAARKTLRTDTARMARFGLEVSLLDWAVPVIYSSGRDIETTKPNMKASESPCCEGSTRELRAQNQDGSQQVPRTQTMGQHSRKVTSTLYRGFVDFVASVSQRLQTIYIQPLKHFAAADTWPIGRNFDILRLEQRLLESGTLFLHGPAGSGKTTLVSHLWHMWHKTNFFERTLYLDLSDDSLSNWQSWEELTSKNLKGYSANDTAKLKGVISDIRSHKSCVILDSTSWPYVSHATASQLAVQVNVFFFIERLLQEQCENCGDRNPFLILVGRDASEKWWQSHFKQLQGSLFPLGGLDLSGAILMCEEIMREGGVNVPKSDQNDLNFLIHIINLLQRNPLALKTIVPAAVNEKVRLASLFELLLIGEYNFPEGFADKLTVSFQKTFWNPIQTLLKETDQLDLIGNFMLFLAPFWTKGPSDIYKYLKTINIPLRTKIDPEEFVSFIRRFHDLGAISCEGAAISWMHPVFNLMLSNEIRLLNETSPKLSKMVECVFLVIAGDDLPISLDNLCQPVAPDIDVEFARFYFIALRIFHILGRKYPPTPTELWFCELVTIFPHKAGVILSMPEQELLLSFIKRAILTSIEHNPDYSFESDLLPVVWNLINFVATFYARTAGFGDPAFRQFTMIGIELLDSFESRNGTVPGFLKIFKNWVYRHKAFMLLHDGDEAAADRAWEAGKDYNILPRQSWTGVSNESVFSLQTASPQDQLALLASIPKQSGDVLGKVWEDIKKNYQAYREGRINSLYDNVLRKDPKPFWMKDGSFDHMTQLIDELGLGDLGVSKQAVNDAGRSLDTPEALMSALESARDVGDDQNQRAFATYLGYTAMRNGKFPQQTPRFDLITSFMQGSSTTDSQQAVISLIMRLADFMTKQSSLDMNARVTTEEKEKYLAAYNEAVDMVRQISGDLYADRLKSVLNVCVNGSKLPPDKIQEGIENCQKIFGEGSEITEAIRGFCASSSQNT